MVLLNNILRSIYKSTIENKLIFKINNTTKKKKKKRHISQIYFRQNPFLYNKKSFILGAFFRKLNSPYQI